MLYTFILNHRIEFIFFYGITSEWTKQNSFYCMRTIKQLIIITSYIIKFKLVFPNFLKSWEIIK